MWPMYCVHEENFIGLQILTVFFRFYFVIKTTFACELRRLKLWCMLWLYAGIGIICRDCDYLQVLWLSSGIVIIYRYCDYLQGLWLSAGIVTIYRDCDYLQVLWLSVGIVIICRNCDYMQELWLSSGIVIICRDCDYLQELWLSAGIVIICRNCDYLQVLWLSSGICTLMWLLSFWRKMYSLCRSDCCCNWRMCRRCISRNTTESSVASYNVF